MVDCEVHFDLSLTGSDSLMAAIGSGGLHVEKKLLVRTAFSQPLARSAR